MKRVLTLIGCLLLAACDEKDKIDYGDFQETVKALAPTPDTKDCGDYRFDRDLREFNCCLAGEIEAGLPVTGTLRDHERTLGQGYVVNADRSGQAVIYFRFVGEFPTFDAFGHFGTQHVDSRDIDQANCPQWVLEDNACNLSNRVAISCPDLSDFR